MTAKYRSNRTSVFFDRTAIRTNVSERERMSGERFARIRKTVYITVFGKIRSRSDCNVNEPLHIKLISILSVPTYKMVHNNDYAVHCNTVQHYFIQIS
jgi:hypothetical protein